MTIHKMSFASALLFWMLLHPQLSNAGNGNSGQPVYKDSAFLQEYSIQYRYQAGSSQPLFSKVRSDRNGLVQVLSSAGLLKKSAGQFLYPGSLTADRSYLPLVDMHIKDMVLYQNQFVYANTKAIVSNAWAGKLYYPYHLPALSHFCAGEDFHFLLSDGTSLEYLHQGDILAQLTLTDDLIDMSYDAKARLFWLLGSHSLSVYNPKENKITIKYKGEGFTAFGYWENKKQWIIGTHQGYITIYEKTGEPIGNLQNTLPCNDITVVRVINGKPWFGSVNGAFNLTKAGTYKYYASSRWLPSNLVKDIAEGTNGTVLILTENGLAEIHTVAITLYDKAMYFEEQVRNRHIRLGFNATLTGLKNADPATGSLEDSDNDGLWTAMYLGAEVFRYAATQSSEALNHCRESLEAMERLYTVTRIKGFPARSFERTGYEISDVNKPGPGGGIQQEYPGNASVVSPTAIWRPSAEPAFDWKSTTSSDEAIGHMFVFATIAELIDQPEIKNKAIALMDALMQHIVDHDYYMIDWNGKPTTWGRWNPEYVNARPENVGDRKITASNITSMLQTAYHFTGKKVYKEKALALLYHDGYLKNLERPMKDIGHAPATADQLSKDLSDGWNHSDDEMYFLGYWGLYRYALNDTLKTRFKKAILDHWQIERPEKEGAWNIFTALTGVPDFDLKEAIWYLQKHPLDLINWQVSNSSRKDILFIPQNFRNQTIEKVLPPDELPINRHNANRFELDGGDPNGGTEYSAGDIWLLPYWMGRYLKVISPPVIQSTNSYQPKLFLK